MIGLEKPHLSIAESYSFRKVLRTKKNAWFHLKCLFAVYFTQQIGPWFCQI